MTRQKLYTLLSLPILALTIVLMVTGCGSNNSDASHSSSNRTAALNIFVHADAGLIGAVRVGQLATLDGSRSVSSTSASLTFDWSFTSRPYSSKAVLQNPTSANPSFIADVAGTYMIQLVISVEGVSSQRAIATVEATTPDNFLTGKHLHTSYTSQCAECHDGRYAIPVPPLAAVMAKSGNHIATSNMCQACHTTFGFDVRRYTDHIEVFGKCSACHNGVRAIGKSDSHIETSAECSDCHTTNNFLKVSADGKYDHSDITKGCAACHNGTTALGKHETHPATNSDCSFCHTTVSFKGTYPDHSTIKNGCANCHNGKDAKGPKDGHPVMDFSIVDCSICHNVASFNMGGVFSHNVIVPPIKCADCHTDSNSINAPGKASATNHLVTSTDCSACHNTTSFSKAFVDHTGPEVVGKSCASCHKDTGPGLPKSANHMPTNSDCQECHTTGTFSTGIFDHNRKDLYDSSLPCASCHNNVVSIGKLDNHIPTNPADQSCADCHDTTSFKGAVFDHKGISSGCAECHNNTISKGKDTSHMTTVRDCSQCHDSSNFTSFKMTSFNHLDVNKNCASCHDGIIAKGKKPNHIPALPECSQCHIDTNSFASSIFFSDVHKDMLTGCEGCHTSKYFPTKPFIKSASHLPTQQDCHFCHTNDMFTPQIFTHKDISGNCASCHNGNYVIPAGALGKTPSPPHPATTDDCGTCHGIGADFKNNVFDHTGRVNNCAECHGDKATGNAKKKGSNHFATTEDCSVCHVPGSFKTAVFDHTGITHSCAACHGGAVPTATVMSTHHIPLNVPPQDCSVCHNTTAFAGAKYDHTGIVNGCALCHDGIITKGKKPNHVPTDDDCSTCHQTTGFKPATFAHTGIVGNCQSCHDGVFAQGKKDGHLMTSFDCGVCHTPKGFKPATYDHSTVSATTRCDSCHGAGATGKDAKTNPPHLATSLDCRACHTTATFVGGTWVHDASTAGICKSCHSTTGGATPQPTTGHFITTVQCDACHNTSGWAPANTFDHCPNTTAATCPSVNDYPGNHKKALACITCHTKNSEAVTYPYPTDTANPPQSLVPYCAACHRNKFKSESKHIGGSSGTVFQNKNCGGSGCHKVSSSGF